MIKKTIIQSSRHILRLKNQNCLFLYRTLIPASCWLWLIVFFFLCFKTHSLPHRFWVHWLIKWRRGRGVDTLTFLLPPFWLATQPKQKYFSSFPFYISLNATLCFVIQQLSLLFVLLLSCYTFWRWKCIFKMKNVNQWQIMKKMWQHYVGNFKVCEKECEKCKKCEENVRNLFSIDWKLFVDGPADWCCCFSFLTSISAPTTHCATVQVCTHCSSLHSTKYVVQFTLGCNALLNRKVQLYFSSVHC